VTESQLTTLRQFALCIGNFVFPRESRGNGKDTV